MLDVDGWRLPLRPRMVIAMTTLDSRAVAAARAARNWHKVGPYAARRYAEKRGALPYLVLARVLAAAEVANIGRD